jgi:hypothetical protein
MISQSFSKTPLPELAQEILSFFASEFSLGPCVTHFRSYLPILDFVRLTRGTLVLSTNLLTPSLSKSFHPPRHHSTDSVIYVLTTFCLSSQIQSL